MATTDPDVKPANRDSAHLAALRVHIARWNIEVGPVAHLVAERERLTDLDELPFPDLRLLVGSERLTTMPLMTSWGCPFACNFCSVTALFGRKYRFRSPDSGIAALKATRPGRRAYEPPPKVQQQDRGQERQRHRSHDARRLDRLRLGVADEGDALMALS